jgi:hypothetical protein
LGSSASHLHENDAYCRLRFQVQAGRTATAMTITIEDKAEVCELGTMSLLFYSFLNPSGCTLQETFRVIHGNRTHAYSVCPSHDLCEPV